ncbi:UNVERIFIED_CONTAM: hypothetical protein Sradi_2054000 [Sesamum radiatum]|uniref:Uncharacterized protein n=1 Tax=Sesamum radiatum TaxID=300843 RepID=A0AAW2THC5_SESRA
MEPSNHKEIKLVDRDPNKTIWIGTKLTEDAEKEISTFLRKNVDISLWGLSDFIGINPDVSVHRLYVDPTNRPTKQKKRSFGSERYRIIKQEVSKLLEAGYVAEDQYTILLSNVVVVPKGGGSGECARISCT